MYDAKLLPIVDEKAIRQQFLKTNTSFQVAQQGSEGSLQTAFLIRANLDWIGKLHWPSRQGRKRTPQAGCETQEICQVCGLIEQGPWQRASLTRVKFWGHICLCTRGLYQTNRFWAMTQCRECCE